MTTVTERRNAHSLWIETEPRRYQWAGEPDKHGLWLDCDVFLLDGRIVTNAGVRGTWVISADGRALPAR